MYVLIIVCTQKVVIHSNLITFWVSPMSKLIRIQSKPVNFNFFEENEFCRISTVYSVTVSVSFCHSDFMWNQFIPFWSPILTILAAKNFWVFGNFLHFQVKSLFPFIALIGCVKNKRRRVASLFITDSAHFLCDWMKWTHFLWLPKNYLDFFRENQVNVKRYDSEDWEVPGRNCRQLPFASVRRIM